MLVVIIFFVFNDTATTDIYTYWHTLSLHDALPISLTGLDGRACADVDCIENAVDAANIFEAGAENLICIYESVARGRRRIAGSLIEPHGFCDCLERPGLSETHILDGIEFGHATLEWPAGGKIGRASGRGRVCQYVSNSVVAVSLKKTQN